MKYAKFYPNVFIFIMIAMLVPGCEAVLNEEDISEEPVVLIAPSDGAALTETAIALSWEPLEDADAYQLQIATPSFEMALQVVSDTIVVVNHFPVNLSSGDYEWRVKGLNSAYETVFTTRSFTITE